MTIKRFITFILALIITPAVASYAHNKAESTPHLFSGPYIGIAFGGINTRADASSFTSTSLTSVFNESLTVSNNIDARLVKSSLLGNLSIGIGKVFYDDKLYWGLELFSNLANRDLNHSGRSEVSHRTEINDIQLVNNQDVKPRSLSFGADLKWGKLYNPQTLFLLRTGIVFNKINATTQNTLVYTDSFLNPTVTDTSRLNVYGNKTLTGLRLGLGSERAINNHIHINCDFIYTLFSPNFSFEKTGPTLSPQDNIGGLEVIIPDGFNNKSSVRNIQNAMVMIGVKYYA